MERKAGKKPNGIDTPEGWPPCDPTTVAPTRTFGGVVYPDGANHMFMRNVTREEAKARGWKHFFIGDVCRHGHVAPRNVANPDVCSDCRRVAAGKPTIGATARNKAYRESPKPKTPEGAAPVVIAAPKPLEPDARDKAFLAAYAEYRDIGQAARDCGTTPNLIEARRACNKVFANAMAALEARLDIRKPVIVSALPFEWTDAKRNQLVRTYIDKGSLQDARDAVGCSASQYFEELQSNEAFAAEIAQAKPLALLVMEDKAMQLALAGDSKMLDRITSANRAQTETNPIEKMSVDQLRAHCIRIVREFKLTDRELDPPNGGASASGSGDTASAA